MSNDMAKCDQVVFECMQKVAEVIISSRVLHQRLKSGRSINSKFSLHVEELAFVRHSMEAWKNDLHMPLGIDIFWQEHKQGDSAPHLELLERWEIAYELQDSVESKSSQLRHIYKRAIILLRTLYSFVRMMPAYQVYRRIQKAYDSRDRSTMDTRDDLGFCLYPILENGGGGSGLEFGGIPVEDHGHVVEDSRDPSVGSYSLKPLETPQGKVLLKVTYQRGTNSKALQHGQTSTSPTPRITPNMTSSIIQDYVPDEYEGEHLRHDVRESVGIAVGGDTNQDYRPRLETTPEDATPSSRRLLGGDQQRKRLGRLEGDHQDGMSGPGALPQRNVDSVTPRATIGERYRTNFETPPSRDTETKEGNVGPAPDVIHWPLLEQGHGYAAKRASNVKGQGPAPFLTPGPHRHKLVNTRQGMEPLDLGPTVINDVYEREAGQLAIPSAPRLQSAGHVRSLTRDCGDCYDSARRDSSDDSSVGGAHNQSHSLNTQGSVKVHGMLTAGHQHSALHGAPESTPPFSYYEESVPARPIGTGVDGSPLRLSQPLVTFSPPFYADPVGNPTESETSACESVKGDASLSAPPPPPPNPTVEHQRSKVMYGAPRTSIVALGSSGSPALLETLPESPFEARAQGRPNPVMEMDASTAAGQLSSFLQPPLLQPKLDSRQTAPLQAFGAMSFDEQEELPFATEMHGGIEALEQDRQVSGAEIGTSDSKGILFALCSGFNSTLQSRSVVLTREGHPGQAQPLPPVRYDGADVTSNADVETSTHEVHLQQDAEDTVRTLEEELDGFRQFHQELERQRP